MASQDLGVAAHQASKALVMAAWRSERADMPGDASSLRDPGVDPVGVAPDRLRRQTVEAPLPAGADACRALPGA
jgi:hypothetical protein